MKYYDLMMSGDKETKIFFGNQLKKNKQGIDESYCKEKGAFYLYGQEVGADRITKAYSIGNIYVIDGSPFFDKPIPKIMEHPSRILFFTDEPVPGFDIPIMVKLGGNKSLIDLFVSKIKYEHLYFESINPNGINYELLINFLWEIPRIDLPGEPAEQKKIFMAHFEEIFKPFQKIIDKLNEVADLFNEMIDGYVQEIIKDSKH